LPLLYVTIEKGFKMKKRNNKNIVSVLVLVCSLIGFQAKSQTPITFKMPLIQHWKITGI
jgi:cobalt-zinc-cadmium resistance protein CzcA